MEKVNNYLKLNDKYLKEGDALLEKADYVQASEKFCGGQLPPDKPFGKEEAHLVAMQRMSIFGVLR